MLLYERMTRKSVQRYNKFLTYASFWAFFLLNRIKFYVFNSIEIPFLLYYFPLYFETIISE